ncbi:MAG: aminopeptidase [Lachnospiraceae bacterium]|nr:aminopeptidase [Lachnospiraceae bacterium]
MKKTDLKKYARLIARKGANVQPGQQVVVAAAVTDADFVHMVVDECYKAGASTVSVEWGDDALTLLDYKYADVKDLQEFPRWLQEKWKYRAKKLPARIYIDSSDPDALAAIDQNKQMAVRKVISPKVWKYRKPMEGHYQWTIVAMPSEAWAKKLFPEDTGKQAVEKLWQAIMTTTRLHGDPVKNWEEHSANLAAKCAILNGMNIKTLTYHNSKGTDFTVGLMPQAVFAAGAEDTFEGITFQPNMPTEECFTSPDKRTANGTVMASLPLSLMGKVVSDFGFTFKDGKVVDVIARNEEEKKMLSDLVNMDEGASYLGEVALVPFDSPINQTGLLFYNTLFDENAVCHLAIGMGFTDVIPGYEKMTEEERKALPLNDSVVHTDFMIGTADLSIVAETESGKTVQIFKDGTWAI